MKVEIDAAQRRTPPKRLTAPVTESSGLFMRVSRRLARAHCFKADGRGRSATEPILVEQRRRLSSDLVAGLRHQGQAWSKQSPIEIVEAHQRKIPGDDQAFSRIARMAPIVVMLLPVTNAVGRTPSERMACADAVALAVLPFPSEM